MGSSEKIFLVFGVFLGVIFTASLTAMVSGGEVSGGAYVHRKLVDERQPIAYKDNYKSTLRFVDTTLKTLVSLNNKGVKS